MFSYGTTPFGDLFFICFLQDFRQVVPKSVPAGLENKRTFFADSDRLWLRGMYAMLAIISCNAQLLSVHSFIFIVIVSRLFPFVTTYFGFSPFFVGFYVFFFHNDSFSSFSLNYVSINSIFWFLATFSFPPHLSHFCASIASIIKAFVEFCREFLALFSILSLAFSPCLF